MKLLRLTLLLFGLLVACAAPSATGSQQVEYVCPMTEHPEIFHEPGTCPRCGCKMVEKNSIKTVAILLFEGVQIIDYSAPYEVFGQAHFSVFTVAKTKDRLTTAMGLEVVPKYDFNDAPRADILVLPGGDVNTSDAKVVDWVRSRAAQAEVVLSVCNGAFFLAKAGLLDGLSATTFHAMIEDLRTAAPKTQVVRDQRFVDNGKIVTSAGLTSGMDAALHVVHKLLGRDRAREIALHLEYEWNPDSTYARAALADRYLPNLDLGTGVHIERTSSIGNLDEWRMTGRLTLPIASHIFLDQVSKQVVEKAKWKVLSDASSDAATHRSWTFSDERGRPWRALFVLTPESDAKSFAVEVKLRREDAIPG